MLSLSVEYVVCSIYVQQQFKVIAQRLISSKHADRVVLVK